MQRILVLGGTGMLGHKLVQVLGRNFDVFAVIRAPFEEVAGFGIFDEDRTIANVDVTDINNLKKVIRRVEPDVVINAVGMIKQIAVGAADVGMMQFLNASLPVKLAEMSVELDFRLISISTDCVFSGRKGNYSESDRPDADDIYGTSKLAGEVLSQENCLTLRTSIVGRELRSSHSLIEWFLSRKNGQAAGYVNAIYSGFPTVVFADILGMIIADHPELSGLYHVASKPISKFDLLKIVDRAYGANTVLLPDPTVSIDRSLDAGKFNEATGFFPEPWEKMIERMANDPTPYDQIGKA
ncbi:MAG: dTDP-4-dehydrorhamnose reductase family protein [Pyrinomonadaceae bacterium]